MEYNLNVIGDLITEYVRNKWRELHFFKGSEEVTVQKLKIESKVQLTEGKYCKGYNFLCIFPHLNIQINNLEQGYVGECYIKIGYTHSDKDEKPIEILEEIKEKRINIKPNNNK